MLQVKDHFRLNMYMVSVFFCLGYSICLSDLVGWKLLYKLYHIMDPVQGIIAKKTHGQLPCLFSC